MSEIHFKVSITMSYLEECTWSKNSVLIKKKYLKKSVKLNKQHKIKHKIQKTIEYKIQ